MAYTRDPHALLRLPPSYRLPATTTTTMHCNVVLAGSLGATYDAGDEIAHMDVNWRTGTVRLYLDEEDAMNRVPCETFANALPPCYVRSAREYAMETAAFLCRGHSLGLPGCGCKHGLGDERAAELGISRNEARSGVCALHRTPQAVTPEQLSSELGVYDVVALDDVVAYMQRFHHGIRVIVDPLSGSVTGFESTRMHIGELQNMQDLCKAISTTATVTYLVPSDGYMGMEHDVQELLRTQKVAEIPRESHLAPDRHLLHYRDPQYELPLDARIREMWHNPQLEALAALALRQKKAAKAAKAASRKRKVAAVC